MVWESLLACRNARMIMWGCSNWRDFPPDLPRHTLVFHSFLPPTRFDSGTVRLARTNRERGSCAMFDTHLRQYAVRKIHLSHDRHLPLDQAYQKTLSIGDLVLDSSETKAGSTLTMRESIHASRPVETTSPDCIHVGRHGICSMRSGSGFRGQAVPGSCGLMRAAV